MKKQRKFKLIKEYPGCKFTLGTIVDNKCEYTDTYNSKGYSRCDEAKKEYVENYSEFWKEIIEKEYEILKIQNQGDTRNFWISVGNDQFHWTGWKNTSYPIKIDIDSINKIYSIKRFSDKEIFSIGDKIISGGTVNTILAFEFINENILRIRGDNCYISLDMLAKVKEPLFKTEDVVEIFEGDQYYGVYPKINPNNYDTWVVHHFYTSQFNLENNGFIKRFSTEELAKEYILLHKPVLTLSEVNEVILEYNFSLTTLFQKVRELVKNKIK